MYQVHKTTLTLVGLLMLISSQVLFGKKVPKEEMPLGLSPKAMAKFSRIGDGILVWERGHDGHWSIWTKPLSGGQEKQLIPTEQGRDHFCPKLSPDGSKLAYLSYPHGSNAYDRERSSIGTLWIMDLESKMQKVIAQQARSYVEDRAVTWLDADNLCYLDGEGRTTEVDLKTGATKLIVTVASVPFGYLPSPDMHYATSGNPEFSEFNSKGAITHKRELTGCQPYFTQDSKWGFWMSGTGGPVSAMRLATRETHDILGEKDLRLDSRQNYIYFPMISNGGRLITFAACSVGHDHFSANYDIYVAQLNPVTLELIGYPLRYTDDRSCDRYPDVYVEPLPLGSQYVESGTELEFKAATETTWSFGDGSSAKGITVKHTFIKPGDYWIEATPSSGGNKAAKQTGYVNVRPAKIPSIFNVVRDGEENLLLMFDEEINDTQASVKVEGSGKKLEAKITRDACVLKVIIPADIADDAKLVVEGIRDTAQPPKLMPKKTVSLPHDRWPPAGPRPVFAWRDRNDKTPEVAEARVEAHGKAYWDENGIMKLRGGYFEAIGAAETVANATREKEEIAVEFVITPQPGPAGVTQDFQAILSIGSGTGSDDLVIGQKGLELWLKSTGDQEKIGQLINSVPNHVILWHDQGTVYTSVVGPNTWQKDPLAIDLRTWQPDRLVFGAQLSGANPWRGMLERIMIYNTTFSRKQAVQHAEAALVQRSPVPTKALRLKLLEASAVPTLKEIQPYREALMRHLYETVETSTSGQKVEPKQIVVTHWAWLDGQAMPAQDLKVGDVVDLMLQPKEVHTEISSLFVRDDLGSGFDAEQYFDIGDWSRPIKKR